MSDLIEHQAKAVNAVAAAIEDALARWVVVLRDFSGDEAGWLDEHGHLTTARWMARQFRTRTDAQEHRPAGVRDGCRWRVERYRPLREAVAS